MNMARTEDSRAARLRGELARDRRSRRVSGAIDAQRRLNARRAPARGPRQTQLGLSDSRDAHLTDEIPVATTTRLPNVVPRGNDS
jgi:hypothetical protein